MKLSFKQIKIEAEINMFLKRYLIKIIIFNTDVNLNIHHI